MTKCEMKIQVRTFYKYSVSVLAILRAGHAPQAALEIKFESENGTRSKNEDDDFRNAKRKVKICHFLGNNCQKLREIEVPTGSEYLQSRFRWQATTASKAERIT